MKNKPKIVKVISFVLVLAHIFWSIKKYCKNIFKLLLIEQSQKKVVGIKFGVAFMFLPSSTNENKF